MRALLAVESGYVRLLRPGVRAGSDEVYVGQMGPGQDGFFEFYARDVLPRLREG